MNRAVLPLLLMMVSHPQWAVGKRLVTTLHEGSVSLENTSGFELIGIKVGDRVIPQLNATQSLRIDGAETEPQGGRFSLSQWSDALDQTGSDFAVHHLITAGVIPDAVEPGLAGDPEGSANVRALRAYHGPVFRCGTQSDVCTALLAYASRYLAGSHLEHLLASVEPSATVRVDLPNYQGLPAAVESLRYTFENIGHQTLSSINLPKPWLLDRGLNHELLLSALGMSTSQVSGLSTRIAKDFDGALGAIGSAYSGGYEQAAAQWALEAWRLKPKRELTVSEVRFVCSGFDAGAALSMSRDWYVAALGYLLLISKHCPDTPGQRERFASWFSQQGVSAFAQLRLEDARVLFERAHFFEKSPKTRAQWADTLAELAILRFREGLHGEGRTYLDEAKTLAAFRPKVLAAQDADPGVNQRAKLGIMIIICVLGFFAVRRLRRVWFGELTRVRRRRR